MGHYATVSYDEVRTHLDLREGTTTAENASAESEGDPRPKLLDSDSDLDASPSPRHVRRRLFSSKDEEELLEDTGAKTVQTHEDDPNDG